MTGAELQKILDHRNMVDDHIIGFRLANGGRVMFTDKNIPFDMATNMLDDLGMLYKQLHDSDGRIAHSYTEQAEVIQVILREDLSKGIFVRDIIE